MALRQRNSLKQSENRIIEAERTWNGAGSIEMKQKSFNYNTARVKA